MLLPIDGGPGWLQVMSNVNPLTHVVDAERALFNGDLLEASVLHGAIASVVVLVVGLLVGTTAVRRSLD